MSLPAARTEILGLYRELLRAAQSYHGYNFRNYAIRRVQDGFRSIAPPHSPSSLEFAKEQLEVLRRQAKISSLYAAPDRLVIEQQQQQQQPRF